MSKKGALPCPPNVGLFVGLPGWFVCFWCRAREALRQCLPDQLKDTTFAQVLKDDTTTKRWLAQLVKNLQEGQVTDPRGIPLPPQWSSPSLPTTHTRWGREGELSRKTAQVLSPTGNRQPQCWTALEKRGKVPLPRCMRCPLRLPRGPGLPLLLPGHGRLTQQSATTAPGGCHHQQMLYVQHAQDDPSPPLVPGHWQGEEETVVIAAAL